MRSLLSFFGIIILFVIILQDTAYCNGDMYAISEEALALYRSGRYYDAIEKVQQELNIFEKHFGPDHQEVAATLSILAKLYIEIGDRNKAEQLCKRALDIQEKTIPASLDKAATLSLLSNVYIENWELSKAEPLMQQALTISENSVGQQHEIIAVIQNDLGVLYSKLGQYDKAETAYQRALLINESLGKKSEEISTNLQNLGKLYCDLGTPAKAEALIQRAILILENVFGPDHPRVTSALSLLAEVYCKEGDYTKAKQLCQRAVSIAESTLDQWHPVLAIHLGNLGQIYSDMGDHDSAEKLGLRALKIRERTLGPGHPDVAVSKNSLAMVYLAKGEISKAESFYRQAISIEEKIMGMKYLELVPILQHLATTLAAQNKWDQALSCLQRAALIENSILDQVMGFTSETQKIAFFTQLHFYFDLYLTIVATQEQINSRAMNNAFTVWLKRKGAALEAQRQFRQALIQADDPQGNALFERLSQLCTEITRLTFMGPGEGSAEVYQSRLAELKREQADIEAELAKCSQNYARDRKRSHVDTATVAKALPVGSALVDFAKIDFFNFNTKNPQQELRTQHYIAFVLPAGSPDRLTLIDLGEAKPIEQTVAELRGALQNGQNPEAAILFARRLNRQVFAPLAAGIGNAKNIFISPDGVLNLIPFEILRDSHDRPLIETHTFNYVCSGRDLVGMDDIPAAKGPALVLGDPDFDMGAHSASATSASNAASAASGHMAEGNPPGRTFQRSADLRALTLSPLPATREEAKAVASKLGENARLRLGADAVEGELQKGPAPRYLHLATHGFFLSDQEMQDAVNSRGQEDLSYFSSPRADSGSVQHYENPLARSGIALAGANTTLKGMGIDGIVTAEKFLTMPISGTEIVVLSACQTGLGDVKTGEGVFGLRRAITQAGAKGMVMSMWSVPDKETQELMEFFYDNLAKGMPKAQALRHAALKERDITTKRFNSDNPLYWGAFIYIGDK